AWWILRIALDVPEFPIELSPDRRRVGVAQFGVSQDELRLSELGMGQYARPGRRSALEELRLALKRDKEGKACALEVERPAPVPHIPAGVAAHVNLVLVLVDVDLLTLEAWNLDSVLLFEIIAPSLRRRPEELRRRDAVDLFDYLPALSVQKGPEVVVRE